jgi:hypothetical protein
MGRLNRVLSAAALATAVWPVPALAQQSAPVTPPVHPAALRTVSTVGSGTIKGIVQDERGGPLAGAMVSVLGKAIAMTVTDPEGRFALDRLPAGDYTLRAHLAGFVASPREHVRVGWNTPAVYRLKLQRLETPVGTTGRAADALSARPIMAAGFGLPQIESSDPAGEEDHSHTETAWRLRHLTRSILKDSANAVVLTDDEPAPDSVFGRTEHSVTPTASQLFGELPFTGEVNLLTTGAFAPGALFSGDAMPRGVAYLAIGAPTGAGDWTLRAAMSEGDLSSWIVAGSFVSRRGPRHSYDLGLSYSAQEYQGGNPVALAAVTDSSRNVGEVHVLDRWNVGPGVSFEYGGGYARYDYLERPGLFSPRAGFSLEPVKGTRVIAALSQKMVAPGAEEFLSPGIEGPWLPPERTFSPMAGADLRVERARSLDVLFEHEFSGTYVLGVRRFFQGVNEQLMTVFGLDLSAGRRSVGHYYVASAGSFDAQGWGVRVSTPTSKRMRGSLDYRWTQSRWNSRGDAPASPWASAMLRPKVEEIHDLTTSFQTDIPETATRFFVLYKINTAYARASHELAGPGLDGRFDVQVHQALPFALAGTKWEVLLGVRNLFRDPNSLASVYDELLVVRPPKRVVGGFLVRF